MMVAAKTLTLTAIDIFSDKKLVEAAKAEFQEKRGANFKYIPLLGDREPALDYRK
jgi:aminobenzoyl-glutamate utilization protein B